MSTAIVDPSQAAIDAFFGAAIGEPEDESRALRLGPGEFALQASVRGNSFVTARNRSRRLAHIEHHAYVVWRRSLAGPQPVRFVAQAICGQWIVSAKRADWVYDDPYCRPCGRILDALLDDKRAIEVDF